MLILARFFSSSSFHVRSNRAGFTLLEVLVVAAIIGILAISTAPFISGTLEKRRLIAETEKVVVALKNIQQQSRVAEAGQTYGAMFQNKQIVLKPENISIRLSRNIQIENAEPAELTFGKLTGEPQSNGIATPASIQLSSNRFKTVVTISQAGAIDWSPPERK